VQASQVTGPVEDIFGLVANENYWRADDPAHPEWHPQYLGRTIGRVRELAPITGRPLNIRNYGTKIDGEAGKDGHHWEAVLRDPEAWDTDPDEWLDYTRRVGGQFQYLVNFGSGTAQEAANLVEYVNGTADHDGNGVNYAAMRAGRGAAQPYNVVMWEIGNELYGHWETGHRGDREGDYANPRAKNGGDPPWHGKPASEVSHYAARAAEFARAMRKASPIPIKLYLVGNNWDLGYWGGPERSIKTLMELAGEAVDGVVVHYYPQNGYYGETDSDLLGRSEQFGARLTQLRALLDRYAPPGKRMEIIVSEWNNRDRTNAQTHGLVNGLFVADTLALFANQGVNVANYFAISNYWRAPDSGFTLFEQGDVERPMPTFYALKLFTRTFGTQVVRTQVAGAPVLTAPGGSKGAFQYPALTATASLAADLKTLTLIVVNKHPTSDISTAVTLNDFPALPSGRVLTLTGPSLDADNRGTERVALREGSLAEAGPRFTYTFPARSATALVLTAAAPVAVQTSPAGAVAPAAPTAAPAAASVARAAVVPTLALGVTPAVAGSVALGTVATPTPVRQVAAPSEPVPDSGGAAMIWAALGGAIGGAGLLGLGLWLYGRRWPRPTAAAPDTGYDTLLADLRAAEQQSRRGEPPPPAVPADEPPREE
jgi:alpha-L-arabinofuranosidase